MASLKAIFGVFPETSAYENEREKISREYDRIREIQKSENYKKYLSLKELVNSSGFKNRKTEIEKQSFKNTPEYQEELKYKRLAKQKGIRQYYQTLSSATFKNYQQVTGSKELKEYNELEKYIQSEEYLKVKRYMALSPKKKFLASDLYKTLQQYEAQKKSNRIRAYLKFINHRLYNNYNEIKTSGLLKEYLELEKYTRSGEIEKVKASMKKSEFVLSAEYQKLQQFKELKKNPQLKNYFKLYKSSLRKNFDELNNSDELEAFLELEKYVHSDVFAKKRSEEENQRFEDTEEYKKLQRYNNLKASESISNYFKFIKSKEFQNYKQLDGSETIKNYEDLKKTIESDKFLKVKEYMALSPKQKWEASDEYQQVLEYEKLHSSEQIQWFLSNVNRKEFEWFNQWALTFEDDFTGGKLDRKKWITRYYWGDKILDDTYSLEHEKHAYTDGENLQFAEGALNIVTKKEIKEGKMWNPLIGFMPVTFNYTSGLISTGKSFRQKYGIFEAKIKISENKNVINAFWMLGANILPHIDIVNADKNVYLRKLTGDSSEKVNTFTKRLKREKLSAGYIIYAVEWLPGKVSWKINGMEIASTTTDIPQEEMYMVLSAGLYSDVNGSVLPTDMKIDYVKVYQRNDLK